VPDELYSIDEIAKHGGVSRRTVRYYVQEGLIPPPIGLGRGSRYDETHLRQLIRVKFLQEKGQSLVEIRQTLARRSGNLPSEAHRVGMSMFADLAEAEIPAVSARTDDNATALWRRLSIGDGVELHVASDVRMPSEPQMEFLTQWVRTHFTRR
jgi:DNA-binding transcriptional MerR regulator